MISILQWIMDTKIAPLCTMNKNSSFCLMATLTPAVTTEVQFSRLSNSFFASSLFFLKNLSFPDGSLSFKLSEILTMLLVDIT